MSRSRRKAATVDEYVAASLDGEFDDLDRAYYDAQPPITDFLEAWLAANPTAFVGG
jgi:hypothetical protein